MSLDATVRDFYSHGLLQFGTVTFTCHRELEYRSIYAQLVPSLATSSQARIAANFGGGPPVPTSAHRSHIHIADQNVGWL